MSKFLKICFLYVSNINVIWHVFSSKMKLFIDLVLLSSVKCRSSSLLYSKKDLFFGWILDLFYISDEWSDFTKPSKIMQFFWAHFISSIEIISHQSIGYILWCIYFFLLCYSVKLIILFSKVQLVSNWNFCVWVFVPFAYCFYFYLCSFFVNYL